MQNERTFQPEPPEFTILDATTFEIVACLLAGVGGWILAGDWAIGAALGCIGMTVFLKYRKKATLRALVILSGPIAVVFGLLWSAQAVYEINTHQNLPYLHVDVVGGILVAIISWLSLWKTVSHLPDKWQTPVRRIYH